MARNAAQLLAEAKKLIKLANELERQECQKIGQYVKKLYIEKKINGTSLVSYLDGLYKAEEVKRRAKNKADKQDHVKVPEEPARDILKNAAY